MADENMTGAEPVTPATATVDAYANYKNEDGSLNTGAIDALVKARDTAQTSAKYFQSEASRLKTDVPPEEGKDYVFKSPNEAKYTRFAETEDYKNAIKDLNAWAKESGIGARTFNKVADKYLSDMYEAGSFGDTRTAEEIEAANLLAKQEALKEVQPMLTALGRSYEEQVAYLDQFMESSSVFSSNPEVKDYLYKIGADGATGFRVLSLIAESVAHRGIPSLSIPTASVSVDKAAFDEAYARESSPDKRAAMLADWLNNHNGG